MVATQVETGSVESTDGTVISYRTIGRGPGLLLVPGALAVAADLDGFAAALASGFTVHTIERRGRGASGPQGDAYTAAKELADLEAVRAATRARFVVGHSFGGFLLLEALRNTGATAGAGAPVGVGVGAFDGAAAYEPGVLLDGVGPVTLEWARRCQDELDRGRPRQAFITFVRGVNPETTGRVPRALLGLILAFAIRPAERRRKHALLGGTIREHQEAARVANQPDRYRAITTPTLLMAGRDSDDTAAGRATRQLAGILPRASLVTFGDLDHFGPERAPRRVAAAVADFFAAVGTSGSARAER
ncbi:MULTISPECIES: alpha/beta fold hydrolase [unclassified Parafrankia]|uniref:alpha/beta fold hydrolase n=1 Tax=Parafrankia TaxID=2994362 RepID=UPI000DA56D43|nr:MULTISPECIES: alpha/beta hydrolase [unclassified Parafrankia]TCJ35346.1 alpha/beta hydrolase [Parafrankia sp. BMG5.11]SQD99824.1 Alpha/beta hydrolase fold [Parafrankia sp. Ea1.12]